MWPFLPSGSCWYVTWYPPNKSSRVVLTQMPLGVYRWYFVASCSHYPPGGRPGLWLVLLKATTITSFPLHLKNSLIDEAQSENAGWPRDQIESLLIISIVKSDRWKIYTISKEIVFRLLFLISHSRCIYSVTVQITAHYVYLYWYTLFPRTIFLPSSAILLSLTALLFENLLS